MKYTTEDEIELFNLDILQNLGYSYICGYDIQPEGINQERESFSDVVLQTRLENVLGRINPDIPPYCRQQALRELLNITSPDLISNNETFHQYLSEGITIEYQKEGETRGEQLWLIDWQNPDNNEFLAINQFTVIEDNHNRRPDIILFINGLPLVVIELKNPSDAKADTYKAFNQLQTYKREIPCLFTYNALLVISDGITAKAGSLSADYNRFMEWKTKDGKTKEDHINQLQVLTEGMLNKNTLLDIIRHFTVFEATQTQDSKTNIVTIKKTKKIAAYHQYYAVNKALESIIRASGMGSCTSQQTQGGIKGKTPEDTQSNSHGESPTNTLQESQGQNKPENQAKTLGENLSQTQRISEGNNQPEAQGETPPQTQKESISLNNSGDRRGGVIWHTQGSGKSLSMVFLAGKLVLSKTLNNPTVLVLTDRNDLDDQLFDTFASCRQLLRQAPQQAEDRTKVQELLQVASGGIVFSTIQKFAPTDGETLYPQLSDRSNVIVLADEAHRSQYGFKAKQVDIKDETGKVVGKQTKYGFARYIRDALPHATFVGFTGTPIEQTDKNTKEVFGNYIDIYDIAQAVRDGATVPIYYESRLVSLGLNDWGKQLLEELEEDLQFEDLSSTQKAKAKGTQLEALVGATTRLQVIAEDIVNHFQERQKVNRGKAMIVTMSRSIAVNLYGEIIKLLPDWHNQELTKGKIKVVMTANASDEERLVKHHTNKKDRQILAQRLKDGEDELEMVIVCDMWLTGFDAPCLHTMYIDKPLKAHNLMQAIARINRVYFEKQGGLVVDYLGLASELKKALSFYAESGGKGQPTLDQEVALGLLLSKVEVVEQILYGFDYEHYFKAETGEKLNILIKATDYVCNPDIKERFIREVIALSKAYSLAVPHPEALAKGELISFFQAIQASVYKLEPQEDSLSNRDIETAIRQVVDQALVSDTVVNILDQAGIKNPDISIISDEFIAEVRGMEHKNLAVELLEKLLKDEIRTRRKVNVVQSRKLTQMLEDSLRRYHSHVITVKDVIDELLNISQDVTQADRRGEELGLEPYELAFYDALAQNQSAVDVMGVNELKLLAIALTEKIKKNASIDWNLKESVRARMKVMVKRLLRQYGYPPDMAKLATELVLEQAQVFTKSRV
ncbi:type I site-specific restriction-modification system restriction subunit HsdR (plasmid) [Cyanobacterium sp. HL-69]|uniref:HsdR family type I site-specific deoxyribonuclease n=1 Tax=Cyanobacterium sp. HL-69 TaxID=2054282 RepID=UPI000CA3D926|nr:type I site-specific restriction-modification system restriction subunit HsdR [Cyanobacterium sp. HL-69]